MLKVENATAQHIISTYRIVASKLSATPSKEDLAKAQALYDVAKVCEDALNVAKTLNLHRVEIIISDELIANLAKHS
ncbi:hypothetical protein CkP1_0014 [Citrobacter phage CkP1]|nr:hypothetical protein CkP1_0014 [Citrobacter phage CkP1]